MEKKKLSIFVVVMTIAPMVLFVHQTLAIEFDLFGRPVTLMGYVQQSVGIGIGGDKYDTKQGFQSALFQGLLEVEYSPHADWKFFGSIKGNADWAYPILRNNNEWQDKGFNGSRERLYIFDDGRDLLNELHVTWAPNDFYFRVGKQIVVWGETDGFRLMDHINPADQRRGLSDLQFENTILPLWLARAEYRLPVKPAWLQELGFQFIFNPNLEFRGNESIVPGNDKAGIWAPFVKIPLGGPYPFDFAHLGSFDEHIPKPSGHEGMEYGFRVRSVIYDSIITLNYFYGRDFDPARVALPLPPRMEVSPFDGRLIIHPAMEGFFPRFKFVGATFSRDIPSVKASFLGGVSPVLRFETMYVFNSTYGTSINTFDKADEFRWMVGADWKVKIPFLNAKAYFMISPQFYHRKVLDYPDNFKLNDNATGAPLKHDNYMASLLVNTTYFHNKLQPMFLWLYDITNQASIFKVQASWEQSHHWKYTLGVLLFDGLKKGSGFEIFNNKNQIYATIDYRF
jgi:hypothetical protein